MFILIINLVFNLNMLGISKDSNLFIYCGIATFIGLFVTILFDKKRKKRTKVGVWWSR